MSGSISRKNNKNKITIPEFVFDSLLLSSELNMELNPKFKNYNFWNSYISEVAVRRRSRIALLKNFTKKHQRLSFS